MHARTLGLVVGGAALVAAVAWFARVNLRADPERSAVAADESAAGIAEPSDRVGPSIAGQEATGGALGAQPWLDGPPADSSARDAVESAVPTPVRLELDVSMKPAEEPLLPVGAGPYVFGRAREAGGAPIGSTQLVARLDLNAFNVPTAADGSFAVPMGAWLVSQRAEFERDRTFEEPRQPDEGQDEAPASFDAGIDLLHAGRKAYVLVSVGPHDVDVGDIVLRGSELIASGRVLDERSEPAVRAVVEAIPPLSRLERVGLDPRIVSGQRAVAGDAGRFELYGWGADRRVTLRVSGDDYGEGEPMEVERGATDVVLVVPRSGVVTGRIIAATTVGRPHLTVQATRRRALSRDPARELGAREDPFLDEAGRFELRDLESGAWVVQVSTPHSRVPLCDGIEVDVSPGETVELDPIDLRHLLWTASFGVVDSEGRAVSEGKGVAVGEAQSGRTSYEWFDVSSGRVEVTTLVAPNRIVVCAPGFRDTAVDPTSIPAVVEMKGALAVVVHVQFPEALPRQLIVEGTLRPRRERVGDAKPIGFDRGMRSAESDGMLRLDAGEPGLHELELRLRRQSPDGWSTTCGDVDLPDELGMLRIQERDGLQRYSLVVPAPALQRALRRVGL